MASSSDYIALITSEHANKPKFGALVSMLVQSMADVTNALAAIESGFDLDNAIGIQLDAIGLWVGITRYVSVPISGVYFSFDVTGLGWDQGSWEGPYDTSVGLTKLDDDTYRLLIRAKIGANMWDGTWYGMAPVYGTLFSRYGALVWVNDNQDMSMDIYMAGTYPPAIVQAILRNGLIPLKPEGVHINGYTKTSVSGSPIFGFDVQNSNISGFDTGTWGIPI